MRTPKRKSAAEHQTALSIHTPGLPPAPEQVSQFTHDTYVAHGGLWGIVAKLRKAVRIEIPIGYQDETGFHLGVKQAKNQVK
jgi:hypothetical protein